MELTLENISEQDTARIGKSIAPLLFPGAFIALAYLMTIFNKLTAKHKQG